jgi:multisubunit Na+/H+ antiporter MnhB subunit
MAMFLGHIAFLIESFGVAFGLVLLQLGKENKPLFSRAGWLLIIIGIGGAICTGYYMLDYFWMGHFVHADPSLMVPGRH